MIRAIVCTAVLCSAIHSAHAADDRVFAVWNTLDRSESVFVSDASPTVAFARSESWGSVRATVQLPTGRWYWETLCVYSPGGDFSIGMLWGGPWLDSDPGESGNLQGAGLTVDSMGRVRSHGFVVSDLGPIPSGMTVRHVFDADARTYSIAAGDGPWVDATWLPWVNWPGVSRQPAVGLVTQMPDDFAICYANFGADPFAFAVPPNTNPGVYRSAIFADGFDASAQ